MLVKLDGLSKVIDTKLAALWNALVPMLITLDGIVIDVKPVL